MENATNEEYNPYPCEICKTCKISANPMYDCGEVACYKYERSESHYNEGFWLSDKMNHPVFKRLYNQCPCAMCYPSRRKILMFRFWVWRRKRADKKYHRNEY